MTVSRLLVLPPLLAIVMLSSAALLAEPARAGGGGFCHQPPLEEATGNGVNLASACFSPTLLRVEPGAEVQFHNNDPMPHQVDGVALAWGWREMLAPGSSVAFTFNEEGTYPYSCYLHPGMTGVIVVGDGNSAASGASLPVSEVRQLSAAPAPPAVDTAPKAPAAATIAVAGPPAAEGGHAGLLFAALGALLGGVVVAVAFSARGIRRG